MKTLLIYKKNEDGSPAEKMGVFSSENIEEFSSQAVYLHKEPLAMAFELPEGDDEDIVKPALVPAVEYQSPVAEYWHIEGEEPVYTDPANPAAVYHPAIPEILAVEARYELASDAGLIAAKALKQKEAQIVELYNVMSAEVYGQMAATFGTNNAESASAYEKTWSLMASSPAEWVSLGLKDGSGAALDDSSKIQAFADAKLVAVLAYGKYRMQRIQKFTEAKQAIIDA